MKKARVQISYFLLKELLQLPDDVNIDLVFTPDDRTIYNPDVFEIIISGDGLPDKYSVCDGCRMLNANVIVHTKVVTDKVIIN